jgi:hypothetical protein
MQNEQWLAFPAPEQVQFGLSDLDDCICVSFGHAFPLPVSSYLSDIHSWLSRVNCSGFTPLRHEPLRSGSCCDRALQWLLVLSARTLAKAMYPVKQISAKRLAGRLD